MSDLISREVILRDKVWLCGGYVGDDYAAGYMDALDKVETLIRNTPAVEAEPVIHARWISEIVKKPDWKGQEREYYQPHSCSHCHTADPRRGESRFCSECGAIMDEKVFEPTPIGKLLFSMRVHKRLKSAGILTMEQLQETDKQTLHNIEGLGKQSILEIEEKLAEWQKERNKNG